MNWLYISMILVNNVITYDVTVLSNKEECIIKGKNKTIILDRQYNTSYYKHTIKCIPLPKGENV